MTDLLAEGPPVHLDPRWKAAARVARHAGEFALEFFERAEVSWKPDDSMVTDADRTIQWWLAQEIATAFPGDRIVGEEGPPLVGAPAEAPWVWVLDPVDGTNNFGRGIPGFSISVGILHAGMPVIGAVYDPLADQLFTACAGRGAWLNRRPLRLEPSSPGPRSLVSIRTPYEGEVPAFVQRWLCRYRLRRFGSTALQLCYVAAGALAFIHDHHAALWDIAGAAPVLLEAGGVLTAPDGKSLFPIHPRHCRGEAIQLLAGDPLAHQESLRDVMGAA